MRKAVILGLALLLAAAAGAALAGGQAAGTETKPVTWDNWLAAKSTAEKYDKEGKFVEALQYYLEYTRLAQELGSPMHVAWGKNNAAFMIIKRHKLDATVDLAPAKKLLEEGLAIGSASDECKKCLELNMEYVKLFLR
jgi:hypothetical protein